MKIPKTVVIIGAAHLLTYRTKIPYKANSMPLERSFRDYLIATNSTQTTLYLFPNNTSGNKEMLIDKGGKQRGFIHTAMKYRIPTTELKRIGIVESVQYSSDWWEAHFEKYEHIFEEHPTLYADKETRFSIMAMKLKKGKIVKTNGIHG